MAMYPLLLVSPLICIFFHLLLRQIYHTRQHRLPLPPGPYGFPVLGALPIIGPTPHSSLARLAALHGPIMYLKMGSRHVVVASTASAARTFLTTVDALFANRPSLANFLYAGSNMVLSNYGPRLKLLRKLSSLHFLGSHAITAWFPARRDEVGLMLRSMIASSGGRIIVPEVVLRAMINIIGQAILSRRLFDTAGKDFDEFKEMISDFLNEGGRYNISDFVPAIAWMDLQGVEKKLWRVRQRFDAMITKLLADHKESAHEREGHPDFTDLVMANRRDEEGVMLSDINIKGLILDMFIAGTDTVTVAIEWALAEMLSNPNILAKMQFEMDRVIGKGRRVEESDIQNLTYLKAVCKEVLRLHPPTPLSAPHFTFTSCEVDGYYIPANTRLIVNIWAMGRDPKVWNTPLNFDPERFLIGKGAGMEPLGSDFELLPFGSGRRSCPGKQAGWLMLQYILGSLVHSFNWRLPVEGEKLNMEEKFGIALPKAVPLVALVTPRLVPAAYL